MATVGTFQTPLGRLVSNENEGYQDGVLKILYDIATSPANDGRIGAKLDTIYLGMAGLSHQSTKRLVDRLVHQGLVQKTPRNEYRLAARGMKWVLSHASATILLRTGSYGNGQ